MAVAGHRVPADRVRALPEASEATRQEASGPATRRTTASGPSRRTAERPRQRLDVLVEVERHGPRRRLQRAAEAREACARASRARTPAAGSASASERRRGAATLSSVRRSRERRDVPEDRRDVAVAIQHHREDHERQRKPGRAATLRTRTDARASGKTRRRADPAQQVVQERRALEEPRVLLVDEERDAGDGERRRHREAPRSWLVQLSAYECELDRARRASSPRPRRRERACGSRSWCRRSSPATRGPRGRTRAPARGRRATLAVATPLFRRPPLPAGRARAGGSRSRTASGRAHWRLHRSSSMSSSNPGTTTKWKKSPTAMTSSGGSTNSHQKPCPCGCRSVIRYGWAIAQIDAGQRRRRAERRARSAPARRFVVAEFEFGDELCVHDSPPIVGVSEAADARRRRPSRRRAEA